MPLIRRRQHVKQPRESGETESSVTRITHNYTKHTYLRYLVDLEVGRRDKRREECSVREIAHGFLSNSEGTFSAGGWIARGCKKIASLKILGISRVWKLYASRGGSGEERRREDGIQSASVRIPGGILIR